MTKLKQRKSNKNVSDDNSHILCLDKTPAKLKTYSTKIVGDVALTRYPVSICVGRM